MSDEIKRYEASVDHCNYCPGGCSIEFEHDQDRGGWCKSDDVDKLQAERDQVRDELDKHQTLPALPLHIKVRMLADRDRAIIHMQTIEIYSLKHRCTLDEARAKVSDDE